MRKRDLEKFRKILLDRKKAIVDIAESMREQGMGVEKEDLADEVDLASTETGQTLNLRLRDRELILLKKIDKTIEKLDDGEYGKCESCGEEIGLKRLEARPVTDLCIRCKEEQERVEKGFAE